jgi:hypothetical protein
MQTGTKTWTKTGITTHRIERLAIGLMVVAGLVVGAGHGADAARAKATKGSDKGGKKEKAESAPPGKVGVPAGITLNACGCYRSGSSCVCTNKNAKCDCPEDCEPIGCEAKRQKELDREVAAEMKRAEDEEKKRQAAEAESARKASELEAARQKAEEGGGEEDDAETADKTTEATTEKEKAPEKTTEKAPEKLTRAAHKARPKK